MKEEFLYNLVPGLKREHITIESGFEPSFGRRTDAGASGQHPQIPASSEHLSPNIAIESAFEGRFPDQFQQNLSHQNFKNQTLDLG